MTKPFLLIAGYDYYPGSGTSNWIATYDTKEEAEKEWEYLKKEEYPFEWYEIVDLREWIYDD
jgi:hypothetical protein